jgi:hypothetical protein
MSTNELNSKILDLANYVSAYNKNNGNDISLYKTKINYIKFLLNGNNSTICSCSKGCINIGNICYMIASLQLLNTIPCIRNIEPYDNPNNEKLNSYLRAIFDELNNPNTGTINLRNINVKGVNVYNDVFLQIFTTRADRQHTPIKAAHEWLYAVFAPPSIYYDALPSEPQEFLINGKSIINIDADDEINHLKCITGIVEEIEYCKDIMGNNFKEEILCKKRFIIDVSIETKLKQELKTNGKNLSELLYPILFYDINKELNGDNPNDKCKIKNYESFTKKTYLVPKDMTHVIINILREIHGKPTDHESKIYADPTLIIDGETFVKQGVIWYEDQFHYMYYLYTDDGTQLSRIFNDSESRLIKLNEQQDILENLKTHGLIYLYRRITFNHQKDLITNDKLIITLKRNFKDKYTVLLDSLNNLSKRSRDFINIDIIENTPIFNSKDFIKYINLADEITSDLLNKFTEIEKIKELIDDRIRPQDKLPSADIIYRSKKLGTLKNSAYTYLYLFIKIKNHNHISEINKNLLIEKMFYKDFIDYLIRERSYRPIPGQSDTDPRIKSYIKNNQDFYFSIEDLEDNIKKLTNDLFIEKNILKSDNFIQIVSKLLN